MPQGDPGGHMESSGGYGGSFGGMGGRSGNVSGAEHGGLGYGGMSPGGYNSTTYANNLAGIPGTPGFGARRAAYQAARQRALQRQIRAKQGNRSPAARQAALARHAAQLGPGIVAPAPAPAPAPQLYDPLSSIQSPHPQYVTPSTSPGPHPFSGTYSYSGAQNQEYDPLSSVGPWSGTSSVDANANAWGNFHNATGNIFRQYGGPVAPGGQYTVGENGPETLQMNAQGGGQVIPNNPMDKMAGGFQGGGMQRPLMQQPMMPPRPPMHGGFPGSGGMQRPPNMQPSQMPSHQQLTPQQIQQIQAWRASRPEWSGGGRGGSMNPEMMAWRDARPDRPEGQMTPEQMMAWRTSIQDWKGDRPEMGGMGGPGGDWQQAIQAWRQQRPDFMQGGGGGFPGGGGMQRSPNDNDMLKQRLAQGQMPPQRPQPFKIGGDLRRRHFMEMARRGIG